MGALERQRICDAAQHGGTAEQFNVILISDQMLFDAIGNQSGTTWS
jgi:hypothetical protein